MMQCSMCTSAAGAAAAAAASAAGLASFAGASSSPEYSSSLSDGGIMPAVAGWPTAAVKGNDACPGTNSRHVAAGRMVRTELLAYRPPTFMRACLLCLAFLLSHAGWRHCALTVPFRRFRLPSPCDSATLATHCANMRIGGTSHSETDEPSRGIMRS